MWPLYSQKNSSNSTKIQNESSNSRTTPATLQTKSVVSTCHCCCVLKKLLRKLKRHRHPSFQCRYDPLSYSLNFDTTGCGTLLDEDYYKYYAFSSSDKDGYHPQILTVEGANV
ncbi:hypothetical protein VNO77_01571 [Canavalia gladiata]|uniref:Uncharacterized protein n=1 Tax=Canavalia gladiata TaxID=3824 RepID=A0AAN9MRG9_CANGL